MTLLVVHVDRVNAMRLSIDGVVQGILAAGSDAEDVVLRTDLDSVHVDLRVFPGEGVDPCERRVVVGKEGRRKKRRTSTELAVNRVIDVGHPPVHETEVESAKLKLRFDVDPERVALVTRPRVAPPHRLASRRLVARKRSTHAEGEVGNAVLALNFGREEHGGGRSRDGVSGVSFVELLSLRGVDTAGGVEGDVVGTVWGEKSVPRRKGEVDNYAHANHPRREEKAVATVVGLDRREAMLDVLTTRGMKVDVVEGELLEVERSVSVGRR
jgi:hypothetical protein